MLIVDHPLQRSWIRDIVLDGFQILHLVQVEVGGLILTHSGIRSASFEQGPVCPDARSSISTSDGSWSAWVAVTILIGEFVLSASWLCAFGSVSSRFLVCRAGLASSTCSSDLQEWIAACLDGLLAAISKADWAGSCWAFALTGC